MKARIVLSISALAGIMACHTAKKTSDTAAAAVSDTKTLAAKPANGIYTPGQEELAAIQARFSDASLDQLKTGHTIYSTGACVQCHKAMNIYQRSEAQWAGILADMAQRARLTAEQKDAVYKYILAVKAVKANQLK